MQTIITRYQEDISWLDKAPFSGVIINKGSSVTTQNSGFQVTSHANFGGNQYDICNYIYQNYDSLPDLMMFIQGYPFDHCSEHSFYELVSRGQPCFLDDSASKAKKNRGWRKSLEIDGGFSEKNTSWYVDTINKAVFHKFNYVTCQISSYDEFMDALFQDYSSLEWVRFAPGSQYIITTAQCRRYSRNFWMTLRDFIPRVEGMNGGVEAHLVERALGLILLGVFSERAVMDNAKLQPKQANFYKQVPLYRKILRLL